jgi:hypothetical protein
MNSDRNPIRNNECLGTSLFDGNNASEILLRQHSSTDSIASTSFGYIIVVWGGINGAYAHS